jgi:serine/threonine-protein kinase PknG
VGGNDLTGAIDAYGRVPESSAAHVDAQLAAARVWLEHANSLDDPIAAARIVDRLSLDGARRDQLTAEVLETALPLVQANGHGAPASTILGIELSEPALRVGLERTYRAIARRASTTAERIELVDRANQIRPRTLT